MPSKAKTLPWDMAEYLETKEDMALYLEAALEDGDSQLITAVLGDIARAKGMIAIAQDAGIRHESVCEALLNGGHPEFATVSKILRALGIKLSAATA